MTPDLEAALRSFLALGAVLLLVAGAGWLLRRLVASDLLGGSVGAGGAKGRKARLAIVEVRSLDPRRRLVLVRRDDVEHLLLLGSPGDLVIETGIPAPGSAAPPGSVALPGFVKEDPSP